MDITIFDGLLNNILITAASCVVPLIIGVISNFVCSKNQTLSKVANLCGIVFESFCPIITIVLMYYCVFGQMNLSAIWVCIIGFTISFLGYIPAHYNPEYSFLKNTVVNAVGLISTVFKWSFCASMIATLEMLRVANIQMSMTYDASIFWSVFIISFVILLVIELAKYIAKEKL